MLTIKYIINRKLHKVYVTKHNSANIIAGLLVAGAKVTIDLKDKLCSSH